MWIGGEGWKRAARRRGEWQKGVGGGGRRYKGLPLCTSSFYLLFEMARRERKRRAGGGGDDERVAWEDG